VESNTSIQAKSNSDWCQIKIVDKKIEVTVASYSGIENRTAVVSITAGKDYPVDVPVTQTASKFIVEDLAFDVDFIVSSVKTLVFSQHGVTVAAENDWIDTSYARDSVFITVSRNNNPAVRTGTVKVTSNNITQSITIRQAGRSLAFEDVLGNYEMSYQTSASSAVVKRNIAFTRSATAGYYSVTGLDAGVMQVKFNNASKTLEIYPGQNMGADPSIPGAVFIPLLYSTDGYISWGTDYFYKGVWNNAFDNNMAFTFGDSGTWPDKTTLGLYVVTSIVYPFTAANGTYAARYPYFNISIKKI
jgi:hypothetical protein